MSILINYIESDYGGNIPTNKNHHYFRYDKAHFGFGTSLEVSPIVKGDMLIYQDMIHTKKEDTIKNVKLSLKFLAEGKFKNVICIVNEKKISDEFLNKIKKIKNLKICKVHYHKYDIDYPEKIPPFMYISNLELCLSEERGVFGSMSETSNKNIKSDVVNQVPREVFDCILKQVYDANPIGKNNLINAINRNGGEW